MEILARFRSKTARTIEIAANIGTIDNAVLARLVPYQVDIPMTQIMITARAYLVEELHWPADTKWEDLIDTIFYNYFKSLDPPVILQRWYVGESKK